MKKQFLLIFLFVVIKVNAQTVVDCTYRSFCDSYTTYDIVVSCVVVDTFEHGTSLKIVHRLYGSENRDTIVVWDSDTSGVGDCVNCYGYARFGNIGDSLIVSLNKVDSAVVWQVVGDYAVGGIDCNTFVLSVHNGLVQGFVAGQEYCSFANNCVYGRGYDEFIANISSCAIWTGINDAEISSKIGVSPNPATQIISVNSEQYSVTNFRVFDVSGRTQNVFFEKQGRIFDASIIGLSSGIYFLQIQFDNGEIATKKFVKQ